MRKIKKATSVLLSVLLAFSMTAASFDSVSAAIDENGCYYPGDNVEDTYRYYFAMPNNWLGEYTDTAGVYWWEGTDGCGAVDGSGGTVTWPGYKAQRDEYTSDSYGVYYVDCPTDVPQIVWNNYINGGEDTEAPIYLAARQAHDAQTEFYVAGDSDLYDEAWFEEMEESYNGDISKLGDYADNFFYDEEYGLGFAMNFDNMIYVAPTEPNGERFFDGKPIYIGDWYFYYGDGWYGRYPTMEEAELWGELYSISGTPSSPDEPFVPDYPDDDEGTISFDVKKSGWNLETNKKIYCHIWKYDGSGTSSGTDWPAWQTKTELCSFDTETGIATFDLSKTGHNFDVSDGAVYCVIFSSNTGMQTYNTIMSGSCIGDTMYCTDEQIENPEDSEKKCMVAVWENNPDCGPEKKITSTGNIVGTAYPEGETDASLLANYLLMYYYDPAKTELTQDLINALNVSPLEVMYEVYYRTEDEEQIEIISDILFNCTDPTEGYYDGYYYCINEDGTADIVVYDGSEENLVIPSTIEGYKIQGIEYGAFQYCTDLKSVTISEGITYVGDYAFADCDNLKSVTIPSSVTDIGLYAFGFRQSKYTYEYVKISGFTIKGVKGSVAEEYANEFGFDFIAVEEVILGDVDGNGVVNVLDATLIQKYSAELIEFDETQIKAADVNGDGAINVMDATAVQQMIVNNSGVA